MRKDSAKKHRGLRIRELRSRLGLTQSELAHKCGVGVSFVSLLENGRSDPSSVTLVRLAAALGVTVEYLHSGAGPSPDATAFIPTCIWPSVVYVVANHVLVARGISECNLRDAALQNAIRAAYQCRHFCEFALWAAGQEATGVSKSIISTGSVYRLLSHAKVLGVLDVKEWDRWLAADRRATALRPAWYKESGHAHVYENHRFRVGSPRRCFAFDLEISAKVYTLVRAGPIAVGVDSFAHGFQSSFVARSFPRLFWSASRTWSERRIAAWLWYLQLPMSEFAPLVRLARQYDSHEHFAASAQVQLARLSEDDCDLFVGSFCDSYGLFPSPQDASSYQYGIEMPGRIRRPQSEPMVERRLLRRLSGSADMLDLIFRNGTHEQQAGAARALESIAAGIPVVATTGKDDDAAISADAGTVGSQHSNGPPERLP